MPPRTRSSTRTSSVTTRASVARGRPSQKAEAPGNTSKPSQKSKAKPKPKSKPKATTKVKTEEQEDLEPPRKRVRRSGTKHTSPTGKTHETVLLVNMPVEVLIEVARYVHPLDLIMLSRVNKFLRELFMDKRSALIWRSARENLPGLPPCPDEVSEPQYAAMVFTKRCSVCGSYAPREMNPVLSIRLCARCWVEELVDASKVTDSSLVSVIRGPVPGQSRVWKSWCSYNEARAVKVKLTELTEAGDHEALQQWREERHKLVETRQRNSEPLSIWLVARERQRVRDRNDLKVVHQQEIESRLIKLGWEKGDFVCFDRWRRKQWNSMVYTTKALTDKVWDDLLPRLLGHLKINRDERLERQRFQRQAARRSVLYNWFSATRDLLPAYARATATETTEHAPSAPTQWISYDDRRPEILRQAFPAVSQASEWPEYATLIDNDMSHEQFLADFEEKKPEFQQSIAAWRHELEARLIATLSDDTHPPNFDIPPFTMTFETGESVQPISTLPEDIQKLLRADAIFTTLPLNEYSAPLYYPDSFSRFGADIPKVIYYPKAQEITQALLNALGIPDASYLHLKASGKSFRCGRCPQVMAARRTWQDIINHYLESLRSWKAVTRQRQVQHNKNFVYICTHDINLENPDRPLVRMATPEGDPAIDHPWTYSKCLLCQSVGLHDRVYSQVIVEHVRDVHLVDEPEAGVHYKEQ
ncbi:unnamed protein product [Rhizoctonia solani]|uniref:F-box domain-containing protein n=1 Tax=Rhizoctonia solani TaxID=456999 RepID=A0A8H3HSI6_9AGAM|nr:unnamed protein product [Rhizoctonia solani]